MSFSKGKFLTLRVRICLACGLVMDSHTTAIQILLAYRSSDKDWANKDGSLLILEETLEMASLQRSGTCNLSGNSKCNDLS